MQILQATLEPNQEYIKTRSASIVLVLVMVLLFAFSNSWSACPSGLSQPCSINFNGDVVNNPPLPTYCGYGNAWTIVAVTNCQFNGLTTNCYGCGYSTNGNTSQRDSLTCVYNPSAVGCKPPCDSTKWTCETESRVEQIGSSGSEQITCINGVCYGLPTCTYRSIASTTCRNECGTTTTEESASSPITYEGQCDDDLLNPDKCSTTKCMTSQKTGNYILYKMCGSGKIGNNGEVMIPQVTQTGKGACKDLGFDETPLNVSSSSTSADSVTFTQDCLMYGIGCPAADSSGVDYSKAENRTPQNGCKCEPYDGINFMSRVVCPDGSTSVNYFSCEEFNKTPSSSSESPSSSSSVGSEEGGGVSSALEGDWMTYNQGEDVKSGLAVIDNDLEKNNSLTATGNGILSQILSSLTSTGSASFTPDNYVLTDSNYSGLVDTTKKSLLDSILASLDTTNKMLDTLTISSSGKCPCFTFDFTDISYIGKKFQVDFKSFWGVNFCDLVSTIVMGLASVVAFMLGIGMFIFAKKE